MVFQIEDYADSIVQARLGHESAWHMWLQGFHDIINNCMLDYPSAETYERLILEEHPQFTKLISSALAIKLMKAYFDGFDFESGTIPLHKIDISDISSLIKKVNESGVNPDIAARNFHLPINDSYHLEFPMFIRYNKCRFVYTTCPDCENLDEHGFPEICLRQSVDLSGNMEARDSMKRGTFMYDNRVSVNFLERETIIDSYTSIKNFVEATKV